MRRQVDQLNEFERALTYAASVTISVYRFYKSALRLFDTDFRQMLEEGVMLQIQLRHPWAKIFGAATSAIGTKRTNSMAAVMSANDPKRTRRPTIRA